jgi:hypothetical protein
VWAKVLLAVDRGLVGIPAQVLDRPLHLERPGDRDRRTRLGQHCVRQLVLVLLDEVGQPEHERATLLSRGLGPGAAPEGGPGGRDGLVDLRSIGGPDYGDDRLGRGVDDLDRGSTAGDGFPTHEEGQVVPTAACRRGRGSSDVRGHAHLRW